MNRSLQHLLSSLQCGWASSHCWHASGAQYLLMVTIPSIPMPTNQGLQHLLTHRAGPGMGMRACLDTCHPSWVIPHGAGRSVSSVLVPLYQGEPDRHTPPMYTKPDTVKHHGKHHDYHSPGRSSRRRDRDEYEHRGSSKRYSRSHSPRSPYRRDSHRRSQSRFIPRERTMMRAGGPDSRTPVHKSTGDSPRG